MRAVGALATFLLNRNALDDAEPFCIRCLLLAENAYGMDHHKLVEPLRAIAHLREKQGKFEDAANHLKRAFIIVSNIRGLVHQESQRLLDALLRIFNLCGDLKSAETYAILNLESWKEFGPSPTDISVADAKCKLAKLYLETDRPIKAEALLKDALAIQEDKVGPMHADVGETLYMLATCYCKQGRYDKETENYYHRTLEIFEATYGTESPQAALVLRDIGILHSSRGDVDTAEDFITLSLGMQRRLLGNAHQELVPGMDILAAIYFNQKRFDEAQHLWLKAETILSKALGPTHPRCLQLQKDLKDVSDALKS
eukprot:gene1872-2203_t